MEDIRKILSESGKQLTLNDLTLNDRFNNIKETKKIAKKISENDLKEIIFKKLKNGLKKNGTELILQIEKQLLYTCEILLDFENISYNGRKFDFTCLEDTVFDIHTTPNGLIYCLCSVGGDGQVPVSFILYVDVKNKLKAYMPLKGNIFNEKEFCAYGCEGNCKNTIKDPYSLELNMVEFEKDIEKTIKISE